MININQYYILYFFIYSFLGWMLEVSVIAASRHRLANRGLLNLPLCVSYGLIMCTLIMATGENTRHGFIMFFLSLITVSAVEFIGGHIADRYARRRLWDYMSISAFGGRWSGLLNSLVISFGFFTCLKLIHPFVYIVVRLIPGLLRALLCLGLVLALAMDLFFLMYAQSKIGKENDHLAEWKQNAGIQKKNLGTRISQHIIARLDKAYPSAPFQENDGADTARTEASRPDTARTEAGRSDTARADTALQDASPAVFAKGLCFDKAIWIMLFFGLIGNICETLLVHYQTGIWMRRGSLIFIPISLVWGFGGVLFTVLLLHFSQKDDRYVFIGGFFFGGAYEYLCSVFTETFLGTRFWDYHNMPFNIDGRTNLLFMFVWGAMAFVWVKFGYPRISGMIEKISPVVGKVATWVIVILLSADITLSGAVILRSAIRREDVKAANFLEEYLDINFPDEIVKRNWRNIRFGPNRPD